MSSRVIDDDLLFNVVFKGGSVGTLETSHVPSFLFLKRSAGLHHSLYPHIPGKCIARRASVFTIRCPFWPLNHPNGMIRHDART